MTDTGEAQRPSPDAGSLGRPESSEVTVPTTPPSGPDEPDEQPTQRLDDLWVPGTAAGTGRPAGDTVDSADPPGRAATPRSPWGVRGLVVAGAVVALVAAGAFGAALARGGDDPVDSVNGLAAAGSTSDEEDEDGDGSVGDRLRDWAEEHGGGPDAPPLAWAARASSAG